LADLNTIGRIGGMLKNVYADGIEDQQNMQTVIRKLFKKAKARRVGGDHYEGSVKLGGNRAGVGARNSDDALPNPGRQKNRKYQVFDRAVFGVIKLYDKDIAVAEADEQAFADHMEDEQSGIVQDVMKHMNIITYGDGTGILATVNANTVASNQFVGRVLSGGGLVPNFGDFGTRYLVGDDQIDIWDSTLTVRRTPAGGVTISNVEPTTRTVTMSQPLTLTAGDVVTRYDSVNKEYVGLQLAGDNSSSVTFEALSRSTFPLWRGNVVSASGQALSETLMQQIMSLVEMSSGTSIDTIVCHHAQWDAYISIGTSLKRFMDMKMDMGFETLNYAGVPLIKDPDCPPQIMHFFRRDGIENGVVKALDWLDRDGKVLKYVSGFAAWTAIMAEYGNYLYPRPNKLGRLDQLAVGNTYLR
jgi:hypothetical protein